MIRRSATCSRKQLHWLDARSCAWLAIVLVWFVAETSGGCALNSSTLCRDGRILRAHEVSAHQQRVLTPVVATLSAQYDRERK
jgi:hypothetical protein